MLYILRTDLAEGLQEKAQAAYQEAFEPHGEVVVNDWGTRRMVYPIERVNDGHYVLMTFHSDKKTLQEVQTQMKLDEVVLRQLVVRLEEKLSVAEAN